MNNIDILREQWMWNREACSIWLFVFAACGVILTAILYPSQGHAALAMGLLPLASAGALIGLIYSHVGAKVKALRKSLAGQREDMSEALMAIGAIQSPGIVLMKQEELVLVPLVGKRLTVPLGDIQSVKETGNMFGKGFVWKRAFLIKAPQNKRIGIAVAPSVARRWRSRLIPAEGRRV